MILSLLYDLLYYLPISLTVLSFLHPMLAPEVKFVWVVISVVTGLFLLFMKHLNIRGKVILGGIFLTAAIGGFFIIPGEKRLEFFTSNLWVFWEIILAILCFVISEFAEHYKRVRIVLAAGGVITLIVLLVRGDDIPKIAVGMIIFFVILTIMEILQRRSKKEGDPDPKKHIVALSPFLLVILLATMLIKAPADPYDWGFVKKIGQFFKSEYIKISETVFGQGWDSGGAVIGFSDRGSFGGDLAVSPRTVMEVTAWAESDRTMYLAGKRFDTFDGKEWQKENTEDVDEQLLDSIETYSAILANKGDAPVSDYIQRSNISVVYKDMHTLCVFTPQKTLPNRMLVQYRRPQGPDYLFVDKKVADDKYDIAYYRINRDSEVFLELVAKPQKVTEESFEEAKKELEVGDEVSYEDYVSYHDSIRQKYLPETEISPKMQAYMDELLEGADSDYEKLRRMEEMFHSFHYTHTPGDLPESISSEAEYLDYFIFEKQEGYCSYYATAFVLLARANGIPARYVQGYAVPMGKRRRSEVDSSTGHAWPEAYLEGIGWVRFEPTPGMRVSESWLTDEEVRNNKKNDVDTAPVVLPPSVEDEEEEVKEPIHLEWYQIVIPVAVGALFILLIFAVMAIVKKVRYATLSERGKAVSICKNSLDLLKRVRLGRKDEETLSEYALRVKDELPKERLSFIGTYEEILYSEREVTEADRRQLEAGFKELKRFCRPHSPAQFVRMYILRKG